MTYILKLKKEVGKENAKLEKPRKPALFYRKSHF